MPKYLENLSGALGRTPGLAERFPFSDARRYLHGDLIGSLSEVTKEDGNIEFPRAYDAFGVITGSPNSFPRPHGYAFLWTYQEDRDSRLNLVGHRYYDPSLGRFITRDPLGDGRNWFAYCHNNPLRSVDPSGLKERTELGGSEYTAPPGIWSQLGTGAYDFAVGWGDGASFGLTKYARRWIGEATGRGDLNDYVNYDSLAYTAGQIGGTVNGSYLLGAGGTAAWGGRIRLGGRGTFNDHWLRIEAGPVRVLPWVRGSEVRALHFHLQYFARYRALASIAKLHLPCELWPWIADLWLSESYAHQKRMELGVE